VAAIVQRATQFERTLHERVVRNEGIRPYRLHQFLLANQLPGVLHKIPEGFIDFWAKLDLLSCSQDASLHDVQGEFAELIAEGSRFQVCSKSPGSELFVLILAFLRRCFVTSNPDDCYFAIAGRGRGALPERILANCALLRDRRQIVAGKWVRIRKEKDE